MAERAIILSGPEVRAVLAGTKVQHRVPLRTKSKPSGTVPIVFDAEDGVWYENGGFWSSRCPFGAVGDLLWVREMWSPMTEDCEEDTIARTGPYGTVRVGYFADLGHIDWGDEDGGEALRKDGTPASYWRSPATMPRWASRLTLELTGVRVQRLQDITEEEARAEGVEPPEALVEGYSLFPYKCGFGIAWDSRHPKTPWASSPWCWVLEWKAKEVRNG